MSSTDNMVEVTLKQKDDFLKVKETLTRIGIASKKNKKLYQSCHILHKQGRYFIVHFKELFALDKRPTDFSEDDKGRRNAISMLLAEWGLVDLVAKIDETNPITPINQIKVLSFAEKSEWELISKYNIGRKKNTTEKTVKSS